VHKLVKLQTRIVTLRSTTLLADTYPRHERELEVRRKLDTRISMLLQHDQQRVHVHVLENDDVFANIIKALAVGSELCWLARHKKLLLHAMLPTRCLHRAYRVVGYTELVVVDLLQRRVRCSNLQSVQRAI
jgi:hypothetical protein